MKRNRERTIALLVGAKQYFTGRFCKYNHISFRYTVNGRCIACVPLENERCKQTQRRWREKNRQYCADKTKEFYVANKDHCIAVRNKWRLLNKDRVNENQRRWRQRNIEHVRAWNRRWKKHNADKTRAYGARRCWRVRQATPKWADTDRIEEIYKAARLSTETTGIKHEVDHIIPLINPIVCGLHIPANLQILSESQNKSKSNTFIQT